MRNAFPESTKLNGRRDQSSLRGGERVKARDGTGVTKKKRRPWREKRDRLSAQKQVKRRVQRKS